MPTLQNAQYEAFALARAKGATLNDAYEDAGYAPGNGHAKSIEAMKEARLNLIEAHRLLAELASRRATDRVGLWHLANESKQLAI